MWALYSYCTSLSRVAHWLHHRTITTDLYVYIIKFLHARRRLFRARPPRCQLNHLSHDSQIMWSKYHTIFEIRVINLCDKNHVIILSHEWWKWYKLTRNVSTMTRPFSDCFCRDSYHPTAITESMVWVLHAASLICSRRKLPLEPINTIIKNIFFQVIIDHG